MKTIIFNQLNTFTMKIITLFLTIHLIALQSFTLSAQKEPNPNALLNLVLKPYNVITDKSFNLTVDMIHHNVPLARGVH